MDAPELRDWLVARVAAHAGLPAGAVPVDRPFSALGLDSPRLAAIAGELQTRLGRPVDPSVAFEHPTIEELASALVSGAGPMPMPPADPVRPIGTAEPIAVVGVACRMPGAPDAAAFWRNLVEGVDAVGEVPPDRWAIPGGGTDEAGRHGGFLDDIAGFDARFFRISADEADRMDPQQRLLLEVCWEAIEDAGEIPARLRGSGMGVYVGVSASEYIQRQLADPAAVSPYTATGGSLGMAAGRLAYLLDLRGPALAVDTACSSSLVAAHLAATALRAGECDRAIVAGVNVLLEPELTLGLARAGMLAPDGRCKTFDAAADGYVRGEGCGAVVLKPLSRARADGDRVYAVIRGSAVNSDGASNGVTAPNPAAQRALLADAYRAAGVDPGAVGYVECHGTGTVLGDQIEARSLGAVVAAGRAPGAPCLIGSVKTNVGHLEPAAGIAGLIKTCLALYHGTLPASLHLREPNPHIRFDDLGLEVVTGTRPWGGDGPRLAGVSSFGFTGTNSHVALQSAPAKDPPAAVPDRPLVLPLSARTAEGLDRLRRAVAERIEADPDSARAIAYTAAVRRTHHRPYRLAVTAPGPRRLVEKLHAGYQSPALSPAATAGAPRVAYVFSGQGAQWAGMGRELFGAEPLFASTVRRCDEAVADELGWSIVDALTGTSPRDVDDTAVAQPLTVAVQVALARVLDAYGLVPAAVVGHSVGEISAAVAAGLLGLEAGMLLATRRGHAMAGGEGEGAMLAVGLTRGEAEALVADGVALAAVNAPRGCVLAGDPPVLAAVRDELVAAGVFARWVPVRYAFHSPRMAVAADRLRLSLARDGYEPSTMDQSVPMYSTVLGRPVAGKELDAAYWVRGVSETVDFAGSVAALVEELGGIDAALEIGGHPALRGALREIGSAGPAFAVLHTLERAADSEMGLLDTLSQLFVLGCPVRWAQRHPDRGEVTSLPPYPWDHQRHWIERPRGHRRDAGAYRLLGSAVELAGDPPRHVWEGELDLSRLPDIGDHRVGGAALLPAAGYAELARAAAHGVGFDAVSVSRLELHHALSVDYPTVVQTSLTQSSGEWAFEVHGRAVDAAPGAPWTRYASGRVAPAPDRPGLTDLTDAQLRCLEGVPPPVFYDLLARQGLEYGATFRILRDVWRTPGEAIGSVRAATGSPIDDVAVLDAAVQLVAAAAVRPGDTDGSAGPAIPVGLDAATFWAPPAEATLAHARLRRTDETGLVADLDLVDEAGRPCVSVAGLRMRRSGLGARRPSTQDDAVRRYGVSWLAREVGERRDPGGRWLVLGDAAGVGAAVAERLTRAGATAVGGPAGLDPLDPGQVRRLVEGLGADGPIAGVVCLWGLGEPRRDPAWLPSAVAHLVRALSFAPLGEMPRLLVATRGAQPVGPDGAVRDPAAATVWGLLKAAPIENQVLRVCCVDLDPADSGEGAADALYAELSAYSSAAGTDTEIGYRAGHRHVRRLTEAPALCPVRDELELDPGAAYVVTGGTGGLGRLVAARLRERGAGLVAVLARTAPDAADPGGQTMALRADVADEAALRAALAEVRARKPIRGVVHAAGVLDDRALLDLTPESLRTVLAPKVLGARHLDALTADDPLDWFVLFASAAGVLGSPGQANYAAANAYLDALAHRRRTRGRPALSVDWGPWAEVGMAASRPETAQQRRLRTGTSALDPAASLAELERLILDGRPQAVVVPFDVRHLVQFYPASLGTSFFAEIAVEDMSVLKSIGVQSGARPDLDTPYAAPRNGVERRIAAILQKALGVEPVGVHDSFFDLGGDSVFANQILVEINRVLGVTVDPERAFQNLTVAHLTELAETQMLDRLDRMSDDEATRLLASGPDNPQGSTA